MKWTKEVVAELLATKTKSELDKFCKKHNCSYSNASRRKREFRDVESIGASDEISLAEFMVKGKTEAELAEAGFTPRDLLIDGYERYETRNTHHEKVYHLIPEITPVDIKERIWKYKWSPSGKSYLWIQFPDGLDWKKIKVVSIADLHEGNQSANIKKFREWVSWIASREDVFCFINGDLFENSNGDTLKGVAILEQSVRPRNQRQELLDILAPIAHKILWAIPGNHEDRSRKMDYDPLEWLCDKLGVPYSYFPVYVDLLWNGHVFDFFCQHGTTGSLTKGGKINAATRPQKFQEFTMFTVYAHVHDAIETTTVRVVRDRVNFDLVTKKQYCFICPSFLEYFGSYADKKVLEPGASGTTNCELFANGDYHLNI